MESFRSRRKDVSKEKEECIVEIVLGIFVFAAILISFAYSVIDLIMANNSSLSYMLNADYRSFCQNGLVYTIPCTAECIKFCISNREEIRTNRIIQFHFYIIVFEFCYGIIYLIWSYCNSNLGLAMLTLLAMSIYPAKSMMTAIFYWKRYVILQKEDQICQG